MSGSILAALLARHPTVKQEWAVFRELATETAGRGRTLDLFAINCWPSSGFRAVAYEVKVSRSDFMREIADPSKRAPAEKLAGECYFATPPGLVRPDEVPEGWGLVECGGGGAKVRKVATQRRVESWPISFCASLARRSADEKPAWPPGIWRFEGREITVEQLLVETGKAVADIERAARPRLLREAREELRQEFAPIQAVFNVVQKAIGWPTTPERAAEALSGGRRTISPIEARQLRRTYEQLGAHLRANGLLDDEACVTVPASIAADGSGQ